MWLLWYISFIHNFAAKELKWMQLSILYPCGWNFIPFDKIRKKNCKSVKKEKLKFGSTQMKVYFGIPYKKCKYSWWWRLLPGGLGWSPVAYILKAQIYIYIYIFRHARCICKTMWLFNMTPWQLTFPTFRPPTSGFKVPRTKTWSWFGLPRWCTCVLGKARFVQESMYQFPRFFDGMFLGLFRVETDLGKWELEFSGFGLESRIWGFGEVFFRWIPRIWDLLGYKFQLRDPMGRQPTGLVAALFIGI